MTKEEILAKYGNVQCKFSSYYKYSFSFVGTTEDGATVSLSVGGGSDEIYRYEVTPESLESLNAQSWYSASVKLGDQKLWSEYRY